MKIDLLFLAQKAQKTIDKAKRDAYQFILDKLEQAPKKFDILDHSTEIDKIVEDPKLVSAVKSGFMTFYDQECRRPK